MKDRREEKPKYEYPIHGIDWTGGIGQPAGIYWLDGRIVMAAHGSTVEDLLLEQGAILAATLRFDPDPAERVHTTGQVERVDPEHFVPAGAVVRPSLTRRGSS